MPICQTNDYTLLQIKGKTLLINDKKSQDTHSHTERKIRQRQTRIKY